MSNDFGITLGVDLGDSRTGFAVSDPSGQFAFPVKTVPCAGRGEVAAEMIVREATEQKAVRVVVGDPRNMNGKPSERSRQAAQVVAILCERGVDAVLWDERLSTSEAERFLKDANMNRKKRKEVIDAVAAQRILESFLRVNNK